MGKKLAEPGRVRNSRHREIVSNSVNALQEGLGLEEGNEI